MAQCLRQRQRDDLLPQHRHDGDQKDTLLSIGFDAQVTSLLPDVSRAKLSHTANDDQDCMWSRAHAGLKALRCWPCIVGSELQGDAAMEIMSPRRRTRSRTDPPPAPLPEPDPHHARRQPEQLSTACSRPRGALTTGSHAGRCNGTRVLRDQR